MDYSKDQLRSIFSDLWILSAELECSEIEPKTAAVRLQSALSTMEHLLGCASTHDHAPRPPDLPAAKRKRPTSVVPMHSEDNCNGRSAYELSAQPCDRESPCHREEPYQTVLRENHMHLMNDLQVDSTQLLDKLVEEDVMCAADVESLRRIPNRREKTRTLLTKLAAYGPKKFDKFKRALRCSHLHLFEKLVKSESKTKGMFPTEECIACKIARDVDIGDVVDKLYSSGVLLREDVQNVLQRNSRRASWIIILKCTNDAKSRGLSELWECLKDKYPELAEAVRTETKYIKCYCWKAMASEKDSKAQSLLPISRTASGPYTAIDNHYMSLPHDCSMLSDPNDHTYEKCVDCLEAPIYANVNEIGNYLKEPLYENGRFQQESFELKEHCHAKEISPLENDNGNDERYTRSYSWDNAMYFYPVESISGEEDPTYLHPCNMNSISCLNGNRNEEHECESQGSGESADSGIVRRGAFRRKCGRESK